MTKTIRKIIETREGQEQKSVKLNNLNARITPESNIHLDMVTYKLLVITYIRISNADLTNITILEQTIISVYKCISFESDYIHYTFSYIYVHDDSHKLFKIDQVEYITHIFLDNNQGVKIKISSSIRCQHLASRLVKFNNV